MTHMILTELLDSVGITRVQLAKLMGVSRSKVQRLGEEVTEDVLKAVESYKQTDMASETIPVPMVKHEPVSPGIRHKEPEDYTPREIKLLCMERSGQADWMVAASHGLKVYEFRAMIQRLVDYCKANQVASARLSGV